jgi:hypothetical protein
VRSGNAGASQGAAQFLSEAFSLLGDQHRILCVRADSGFYGDHFLSFLEEPFALHRGGAANQLAQEQALSR